MEKQQYAQRVTRVTLLSHMIGFVATMVNPLFALIIIPVLVFPKFIQTFIASHSWVSLAKFNITTFIFGLINGYTAVSLNQYISSDPSQNIPSPTFQIYLTLITIYHYFQFQLVNNFHHMTLCWQSFLIYHSLNYTIANLFMLCQHIITRYYFSFDYKIYHSFMWVALAIAVVGQGLRAAAFFTCKSNFTHIVSFRKKENHQLVTNGIYSIFRHPSYTGFFYFSIFSQIFIGNFVTAFINFFVLRHFFNDRINTQQAALLRFFPDQYPAYKKKTYILIPFVSDPPMLVSQQNDYED